MTARDSTRRAYLRRTAGAVLASAAVAGCSGGGDTGASTTTAATSTEATTADGDATSTTDGATTTAAIHPGHDYDTTTVRAETPGGDRLGNVTAAIADTPDLRHLGLSETDSLPGDRGMLFVYDQVADRTFVMRRMSFGIDIVYADADGTITRIHHAPEPGPDEDGNEQEYPGTGQYVLEVTLDWTTRHGVEEGDVLAFEV